MFRKLTYNGTKVIYHDIKWYWENQFIRVGYVTRETRNYCKTSWNIWLEIYDYYDLVELFHFHLQCPLVLGIYWFRWFTDQYISNGTEPSQMQSNNIQNNTANTELLLNRPGIYKKWRSFLALILNWIRARKAAGMTYILQQNLP